MVAVVPKKSRIPLACGSWLPSPHAVILALRLRISATLQRKSPCSRALRRALSPLKLVAFLITLVAATGCSPRHRCGGTRRLIVKRRCDQSGQSIRRLPDSARGDWLSISSASPCTVDVDGPLLSGGGSLSTTSTMTDELESPLLSTPRRDNRVGRHPGPAPRYPSSHVQPHRHLASTRQAPRRQPAASSA